MKKRLLITIFRSFIIYSSNAQKIFKSKDQTIQAIQQAGYEIKTTKGVENAFGYTRSDEFGTIGVYIFYEGNIIRRAVFMSGDITNTMSRFKEILQKMGRGTNGQYTDDKNVVISYSTRYYDGRARYSYENNNTSGWYQFIVQPIYD